MRTTISLLALSLLAILAAACSSVSPSMTATSQPAGGKPLTVQSAGKDVLQLTLPAGAKAVVKDEMTTIADAEGHLTFYLWTVAGAKTVDEGVARVGEVIKGEFKNFKPAPAKDLAVAGAPAKQLAGPGTEADDGDAGHAEVIVFQVGGRVFAGCLHGEPVPTAREEAFMLAVLQTARVP